MKGRRNVERKMRDQMGEEVKGDEEVKGEGGGEERRQ